MKKTIFCVLVIGALISIIGAGCSKTATNTTTEATNTSVVTNTAVKNVNTSSNTNTGIANVNSSVNLNTNTSKTNTNTSNLKTYTNTVNGFSFQYPSDWTYAEKSEKFEPADNKTCNSVVFKKGTNELNIFYRKTSDAKSTTSCRTGAGAGDFVKASSTVKFGSLTLEKQDLTLEDKVSSVFYNAKGKTGEIVEGTLGFQIYFDDMTTETVDLSKEEINAADSILSTFQNTK